MTKLYPGAPCTCHPGRYIRFIIPPGVPGCRAVISCRNDNDLNGPTTGPKSLLEHALPPDVEVLVHVPGIGALEGN